MNDLTAIAMENNDEVQESLEQMKVLISRHADYAVVTTDEEASKATEIVARLRAMRKQLDQQRLDMGAGARKTLADINDWFREPIRQIDEAVVVPERGLKSFMLEKQRQQEADRRAEMERQRREEEKQLKRLESAKRDKTIADAATKAEEAARRQQALEAKQVEKVTQGVLGSTAGTRDNWKWRITDIRAVPEEYLVEPEKRVQRGLLNSLAKSGKGKVPVAGIEFYNDPILATRGAK